MQDFVKAQCNEIAAGFSALKALAPSVEAAARLWMDALRRGGKVLFCGNGGSAADAQHLAAELTGRYEMNRPAMAGIALTTDTSAITAIANDFGYDKVFARQVEALGRPGDVLYAISTSGNSPNVVLAAEKAKSMGISVVAVTGADAGRLGALADVALNVPARRTCHVQEMHIAVGHMICSLAEREVCGREPGA